MANLTEMPFWGVELGGLKVPCIRWSPAPPTKSGKCGGKWCRSM